MRVAMVGVGYVGLVSGAGFAEFGNIVVCVDTDSDKIAKLSRAEIPIYEPGLEQLVADNVAAHRLSFTTNLREAVIASDVVFITVGTPSTHDGEADLSAVFAVVREIGSIFRDFSVSRPVVVKSTVPVGTTEKVGSVLSAFTSADPAVANNPEFLREGTAVEDFMRPDRVIIGTSNVQARDALLRLYRPFTSSGKVLVMDPASSELVKYTSNALLAIRIAFMNEIATLAGATGANVNSVREGVGRDSRIGPKYLYPGPGYGGSCLPKDVSALVAMGNRAGINVSMAKAAEDSNFRHKRRLVGRMFTHFGGDLSGKKVCVWGLAFKAETDDVRDSPAFTVVDGLIDNKADVHAHDPQARANAEALYSGRVSFHDDQYEALRGADALIVCTEWREYRSPDFDLIRSIAPKLVVFDVRNLWDPFEMKSSGISYFGLGTTEF